MTPCNQANRTTKSSNALPQAETLLNLAEDSDLEISALAMEQLLKRPDLLSVLARNQDSCSGPRLRRIHQLSSIVNTGLIREAFIHGMMRNKLSAWDGFILLDRLYDPQSSADYLNEMADKYAEEFSPGRKATLDQLAEFMRERGFSVPQPDAPGDYSHYLLGDVLEYRVGVPILLCVIARHLMPKGSPVRFCIKAGQFCLIDNGRRILNPLQNWEIDKKPDPAFFQECGDRDFLTAALCMMFSIAIVEWSPRDIFTFGQLLGKIRRVKLSEMPYPLGRVSMANAMSIDQRPPHP